MPASAAVYGCQGTELASDERAFFRDVRPFGFILFARNVDNPAQVASPVPPIAQLDRRCQRADFHRSGRRKGSAPQAAALAEPPAGASLRRAVRARSGSGARGRLFVRASHRARAQERRRDGELRARARRAGQGAHDIIGDRAYSLDPRHRHRARPRNDRGLSRWRRSAGDQARSRSRPRQCGQPFGASARHGLPRPS